MAGDPVTQTRERSLAVNAVLANADAMGIDQAIERFGRPLTSTEREMLRALSAEEMQSLRSLREKLGNLAAAADNNIIDGNNNVGAAQ